MNPKIPDFATLLLVSPEIALAFTLAAVLLAPLFTPRRLVACSLLSLGGIIGAAALAVFTLSRLPYDPRAVFGGMLVIDPFGQFFKVILLLSVAAVICIWIFARRHEQIAHDAPDFLCLILGAALGMSLMASSNNLLMIFIATETASFPSYALAGFRKQRKRSAEGALKYVLIGSAASALSLYGMSLIYGMTGSLSLPGIADAITSTPAGVSPLLAAGLLLALATPVFKLAAFPLHFWCPDVFEAAPTEVTAFLSVASKSAAVCLVVRILMSLSGPGLATGAVVLAVLGLLTSTWGNLLAMRQERIKRLLAFSSVAHAGYLIMAASVILVTGQGAADSIPGAILFYLLVYALMNLGAFGVVAILETTPRGGSAAGGQVDLKSLDGLVTAQPWLAVLFSGFLIGLMGLPGLGGFVAKFALLKAVIEPWPGLIGVGVIAAVLVNAMMGLYAYLRPIYHMALMPPEATHGQVNPQGQGGILALPGAWAVIICCAVGLLWLGVLPDGALTLTGDFGTLRTAIVPVRKIPADDSKPKTVEPVPAAGLHDVDGTEMLSKN